MKKQATLFPQDAVKILAELDLEEAQRTAAQVKAAVEAQCELIEVAGSIRRQKSKVHDIDFVVVAKSDAEWLKINDKLRQLKLSLTAREIASLKRLCPAKLGFFRWISTVLSHRLLAFFCLSALVQLNIICGLPAVPFRRE